MNWNVKMINRLALLSCAPFIGMLIWIVATGGLMLELSDRAFPEPSSQRPPEHLTHTAMLSQRLDDAQATAVVTADKLKESTRLYSQTNKDMKSIVQTVTTQAARPAKIYDRRITIKLGTPSSTVQSDKLRAQLFHIKAQNFNGYALKVKLKAEDAMKMVLGNDKFGGAETTLSATQRYKALAGVNAGGFADQGGERYPLSTTVLDGEYVNGFEASFKDLFFVGVNKDLKLVGGNYSSKTELDNEQAMFGASFVPILLKNGYRQTIPLKWQTSPKRTARTVVANYKDDQLLFIVTDGANNSGASGATLAEMQTLLIRFGAVDAYNLDGGGSSSLIFNGRVVNNPKDGQLRKLSTHFLFFK
ncbi:phosphodiester glycosidase family protein [Paenibacillaceae bacterium]|nr:phosphodiester glycosidase family protein [Paenibacillaceae bacterium]